MPDQQYHNSSSRDDFSDINPIGPPELPCRLSAQNSTVSASKFQPLALSQSSSQPGTITVNISLVQTSRKNKKCQNKKNRDETVVCEISCEQSNEDMGCLYDGAQEYDLGVCANDECFLKQALIGGSQVSSKMFSPDYFESCPLKQEKECRPKTSTGIPNEGFCELGPNRLDRPYGEFNLKKTKLSSGMCNEEICDVGSNRVDRQCGEFNLKKNKANAGICNEDFCEMGPNKIDRQCGEFNMKKTKTSTGICSDDFCEIGSNKVDKQCGEFNMKKNKVYCGMGNEDFCEVGPNKIDRQCGEFNMKKTKTSTGICSEDFCEIGSNKVDRQCGEVNSKRNTCSQPGGLKLDNKCFETQADVDCCAIPQVSQSLECSENKADLLPDEETKATKSGNVCQPNRLSSKSSKDSTCYKKSTKEFCEAVRGTNVPYKDDPLAPSFTKQPCCTEITFDEVLETVEGFRKSKIPNSSLRSRKSLHSNPQENLSRMCDISQRTPSWKFRTPDPALMMIDESTDKETPGLYQGRMGKTSRFSGVFMGADETADARSHKITCDCRVLILEMYKIVGKIFQLLTEAVDMIPCKDFSKCGEILSLMQSFHENFVKMLKSLRYSPYEEEMLSINCGLNHLLEDLELQPAFVLVRMIEFGYFLYEIGRLINEEFIPSCFVHLIHTIQTRLYVSPFLFPIFFSHKWMEWNGRMKLINIFYNLLILDRNLDQVELLDKYSLYPTLTIQ